jgi:hypothetical protein
MSLNFITDPVPEFSYEEEMGNQTFISQFVNRAEQRRSAWSQPYKIFTLKYNIKTREEIDRLWNFYQLCRGSFKAFNYQKPFAMIPYDQVTAWLPLHEGSGIKCDDWNGFIFPTYSCRFMEDKLSYEEFTVRIQRIGIKLYQESPLVFTNNYGALSGSATWITCPDGSQGVSFDGSSGRLAIADCAALDVGTGNFSFAFAIYPNSLAAQLRALSKKTTDVVGTAGYNLVCATNGQITIHLSDGTHQDSIVSAAGALTSQTWKLVTVTFNRAGTAQIYVNNVASGSPVTITATSTADNATSLYLGYTEGIGYGNLAMRNFLFAKKVWTQAELDQIWATWRGILKI